jgi:hypothetical protein
MKQNYFSLCKICFAYKCQHLCSISDLKTRKNKHNFDAYLEMHKLQSKFELDPKIKLEKLSSLISLNSSTYAKT